MCLKTSQPAKQDKQRGEKKPPGLLDEPAGNLDHRHRKELIKFLGNLNITLVISTHDISMVSAICNKVAIMDKGRMVAYGMKEDIFTNRKLLRTYDLD